MLRCWLVVLAGMLLSASGWARSGDRVEVFGGYSYVARDISSGSIGNGGLKLGWNASLDLKYSRLLGFVSDFGGHYNHQNSAGVCTGGMTSCSSSAYTAMFGPGFLSPAENNALRSRLVRNCPRHSEWNVAGRSFPGKQFLRRCFGGRPRLPPHSSLCIAGTGRLPPHSV